MFMSFIAHSLLRRCRAWVFAGRRSARQSKGCGSGEKVKGNRRGDQLRWRRSAAMAMTWRRNIRSKISRRAKRFDATRKAHRSAAA
jgi:hypothetical protein